MSTAANAPASEERMSRNHCMAPREKQAEERQKYDAEAVQMKEIYSIAHLKRNNQEGIF